MISEGTAATSQRDIVMELVERCESEAIRITRATLPTPLTDCANKGTRSISIDLACFIAGTTGRSSDRLVTGVDEQLGRLKAAVHWDKNKKTLTDLRDLADDVLKAATCLRDFPKNGQLQKAKMIKAGWAAKVVRNFLENSELLSYLFEGSPAIGLNKNGITEEALKLISERASAAEAEIGKNGAPKKQADIQVPHWDHFVSEMSWIADLAFHGASVRSEGGRPTKKGMTPLSSDEALRKKDAREDRLRRKEKQKRAARHDDAAKAYSPKLHCVVIIGIANSFVSEGRRLSKSGISFSKNASEACEMLWRAAGGEEHKEHSDEGAEFKIYPFWEGIIRYARRAFCAPLVHDVKRSFR